MLSRRIDSLPPPRPVPWKMKELSGAKTEIRTLPDGRFYVGIRHEVLRGVTPEMLVWWFSHLEGDMELGGRTYPRYQIWHPIDHISIRYARRSLDGTIGPGAQIHIREALGGNLDYLVDIVTTIERLDEGGFVHGPHVLGMPLIHLEYAFTPVAGGTLYENSITAGPELPPLRAFFNRFLRPRFFPEEKARAWLRHNVEEVGNFEFFLPELWAKETGREAR